MERLLIAAAGAFALATGAITFLVGISEPAEAATALAQTATFAVANMTCATCPITVKTAMKGVPGVRLVNVSFEKKTAMVTFDSSRTNPATIAAASTGVGFPAKLLR